MAIIKITEGKYKSIHGDQHRNNLAYRWDYEPYFKVNGNRQIIMACGSVHGAIHATVNPPSLLREIGFNIYIKEKDLKDSEENWGIGYKISIQEQRYNGVAVHVALPTLMQEIFLRAGQYSLKVEPLPGTACERTSAGMDIFSIFIYD